MIKIQKAGCSNALHSAFVSAFIYERVMFKLYLQKYSLYLYNSIHISTLLPWKNQGRESVDDSLEGKSLEQSD